jgi:hypothetical protein
LVNLTVPPVAIVVSAGEKQNVEQLGPLSATDTVALWVAWARAAGARVVAGAAVVLVPAGTVVVLGVVGGVVVVVVEVRAGAGAGAAVGVLDVDVEGSAGAAPAGSEVSPTRARLTAASTVVRRMIGSQRLCRVVRRVGWSGVSGDPARPSTAHATMRYERY